MTEEASYSEPSRSHGPNQVAPTALVMGAGAPQGLGAAIARRFAREGYRVVIAGRNAEKLKATEAAFNSLGLDAEIVIADVTTQQGVERAIDVAQHLGQLSIAVHNAGANEPAPFLASDEAHFTRHWKEHTLGAFLLAQAAIPRLLANGGGTLAFTGASGSLRGRAHYASFAAAKSGARMLAQSLAREFGPNGIHVAHVVIDGGIDGDRLLSLRPRLKEERGPDGMLSIDAVAEAYWTLHHQHRSAWTFEMDLRPWSETF